MSVELLSDYNYFKQHPEKVLGVWAEKQTRYGGTATTFKESDAGYETDLANLLAKLPNCKQSNLSDTVINQTADPQLPTLVQLQNIEKAIQKAPVEQTKRSKQKGFKAPKDANTDLGDLWSFDDVDSIYNAHISAEEKQAFVYWQRAILGRPMEGGWKKYHISSLSSEVKKLVAAKALLYNGKNYEPAFILASGDLYGKLDSLTNEFAVVSVYMDLGFSEQEAQDLLNFSKELIQNKANEGYIKRLVFSAEKSTEGSLNINPNSEITRNTEVNGVSILTAFLRFLYENSDLITASSYNDIEELAINMRRRGKDESPEYYNQAKSNAMKESERLFALFMSEYVDSTVRESIEQQFHRQYNSQVEPDLNQVPIGFTCAPLGIKSEKREAIAKAVLNGSLCIAYGVGLGKTWCASYVMAQFMENGWAKRPLLSVPLQVYPQFINELKKIVPNIPVIELGNLSAKYLDERLEYKGKGIFICTHDGMMRFGFSPKEYANIASSFFPILFNEDTDTSQTAQAKKGVKAETKLGEALRGSTINLDVLGIDFIAIDEAHNAKKIFTSVNIPNGDNSTKTKKYSLSSGEPSMFGLKTFVITQYINQKNPTANVLLLTATPFTNSPLEIYSFLLLLDYKYMLRKGLVNMYNFFDLFADISLQLVVTNDLRLDFKQVFTGFKQLPALQKIIQRYFLYKQITNDLSRPNKHVIPSKNAIVGDLALENAKGVSSILSPTELQKDAIAQARSKLSHLKSGMSSRNFQKIKAEMLKVMTIMRLVSVSPYLLDKHPEFYGGLELPPLDHKTYVASSSKLQYVMDCIKSVKDDAERRKAPVGGQIVYMGVGTDFFPLLKKYLVDEIGYQPHEVAFITGSMSPDEGTKSQVQDKFMGRHYNNATEKYEVIPDEYRVKVLIGSSSITEGLNLQRHCVAIYNCYLEWNPTDAIQLEGRGWRQGNLYKNMRMVYPLVQDSVDVFIFQKIEEKTKRINAIWNFGGNASAVDLSDYDPNELKYQLISDPAIIAALEREEEIEKINARIALLSGERKKVELAAATLYLARKMYQSIEPDRSNNPYVVSSIDQLLRGIENEKLEQEIKTSIKELLTRHPNCKQGIGLLAFYEDYFQFYNETKKRLTKYAEQSGVYNEQARQFRYSNAPNKTEPEKPEYYINSGIHYYFPSHWTDFRGRRLSDIKKDIEKVEVFYKNVIAPLGYTDISIDAFESVAAQKKVAIDTTTQSLNQFDSKWLANKVSEIDQRQQQSKSVYITVEKRVKEFASLNGLLVDKVDDGNDCKWGKGQTPQALVKSKYKVLVDTEGTSQRVEVLQVFQRENCLPMYLVKFGNKYVDFATENEFVELQPAAATKPTNRKLNAVLAKLLKSSDNRRNRLGELNLDYLEQSYLNEGTEKGFIPSVIRNSSADLQKEIDDIVQDISPEARGARFDEYLGRISKTMETELDRVADSLTSGLNQRLTRYYFMNVMQQLAYEAYENGENALYNFFVRARIKYSQYSKKGTTALDYIYELMFEQAIKPYLKGKGISIK